MEKLPSKQRIGASEKLAMLGAMSVGGQVRGARGLVAGWAGQLGVLAP